MSFWGNTLRKNYVPFVRHAGVAPADVTGASNGSGRTRVGRSHRRRLAHHFAGVYVIERCFVSS